MRGVHDVAVRTTIADLSAPPVDTYDAYLRLHLLSHRLVRPNTINLEGLFGHLNNVVWTQLGPVAVDDIDAARGRARAAGTPLLVHSIDKFPRMLDYVVPTGVRVADADRVRLGAHLAEGTTVMHEGFVNFNAGTVGTAMVEGRISQGVVVGEGSDIGGGASIMGTLSGGGTEIVRIGERCLLGANAGLGHLARRRLHRRGRPLPHGRLARHDDRRLSREGSGPERAERSPVPAQQHVGRHRGAGARGALRRAQRGAAPELRRSATRSMRSSGCTTATRTWPAPAGP